MNSTSCTRREFFARAAAGTFAAAASRGFAFAAIQRDPVRPDVPWLQEVLERPTGADDSSPSLAALLVDADGHVIRTLKGWRKRRLELVRTWQRLLGTREIKRKRAPHVEIVEEELVDGIVRQRVRYEVERGARTEAYVLRPQQARSRLPGAIVFHSTVPESIRQPAGLADVAEKHFGLALASRGFVAFCPRNFLWPENTRMSAEDETRRFHVRHPRASGMAKMLHDGQVALDILAARSDVDARRIGCIGHSLGAKEALYLAAFDARITAAVSSEGPPFPACWRRLRRWRRELAVDRGRPARVPALRLAATPRTVRSQRRACRASGRHATPARVDRDVRLSGSQGTDRTVAELPAKPHAAGVAKPFYARLPRRLTA